MKNGYFYFLVEPIQEKYDDGSDIKPSVSIPLVTKDKTYELAVYSTQNRIYMLRIKVPGLKEEKISEEDLKFIQILKEHLLSILRITYDRNVDFFYANMRNFIDETKPPDFHITLKSHVNKQFRVNLENIRSSYINSFPLKEYLRLLSDGLNEKIPMQYRYLSLYKLLELRYKRKNKWTKEFSEFLSTFEVDFKKSEFSRLSLLNYLKSLRDRCAHIKTSKEVLGVTQLDNRSMLEISKFFPFLTNMCLTVINDLSGEKGFRLAREQIGYKGVVTPINKKELKTT